MKNFRFSKSIIYFLIFSLMFFLPGEFLLSGNNQSKSSKSKEAKPPHHKDKKGLDCKSCHECEYPTRQDPCLNTCPREGLVSVYHAPSEGPKVVIMDQMKGDYAPTVFSHLLHAEMSEMSHGGCQGCHHYNTTGPILACKKCHESERKRTNIKTPDLKAAYHRQCVPCHRQWNINSNCNNCHSPKKKHNPEHLAREKDRVESTVHPYIAEPHRILYETNYKKGKFISFYHNDHVGLFSLNCNTCHKDENCIKCHNKSNFVTNTVNPFDKELKVKKTIDEHHKPCNTCHKNDNCQYCHKNGPVNSFNHDASVGWPLKGYHDGLSCIKCHANGKFSKINNNCGSCHKNFKPGKFNHKSTGMLLSEDHSELDCESCHEDPNYKKQPVCESCHDDKNFPKHLPGKKIAGKSKKGATSSSTSYK